MAHIEESLVDDVLRTVQHALGPREFAVFEACFTNTLATTMETLDDGTVYLVTGDIPAMWLRDSAAQVSPYLHFARQDPTVADTIARLVERQLRYILLDPYANAFNREPNGHGHQTDLTDLNPWVWERKYEIDSLCYPVLLAHDLWKVTGDDSHLRGTFPEAVRVILEVLRTEQHHEAQSPYRFQRMDGASTDTLAREGRGGLVAPVGLTWSGFRPSDDACELGYNIPANAFACVALRAIVEIATAVLGDGELATGARELEAELRAAIEQHGTIDDGAAYAYEVDGAGATLFMDDANVPSLLAMPYFGWCEPDDPRYLETRARVLSSRNPYFFEGSAASGVGSPHTPERHVWPIALAIQGLTTTDRDEQRRILALLARTDAGTDLMHESFHVDDPATFTRPWFSWANAMYCELALELAGLRSYRRTPVLARVDP